MEEYKIDVVALLKEMHNDSMNKALLNAIPDDTAKAQFYKILCGFNKRGVSTQTVFEVLMEAMAGGQGES